MRELLACLILAVALLGGPALVPAQASEADDQLQVVKKYLDAYVRRDMTAIRKYTPDREDNLFGPYPFKGDLKLVCVKVDDNQALLEFRGTTPDSKYPAEGGILFKQQDGVWYVRQVLHYSDIPRIFGLPTKSVTADDRREEPRVKAVGEAFLNAWKRNDVGMMKQNWYNWPQSNGEPIKGLSMGDLTLDISSTAWKEPYVRYSAKLTYRFGILRYSMIFKGGLALVKESGDWKVRGNQMVFYF